MTYIETLEEWTFFRYRYPFFFLLGDGKQKGGELADLYHYVAEQLFHNTTFARIKASLLEEKDR